LKVTHPRRTAAAVLALTALLAAGCSSDASEPEASPTESTATTPTPTSTPASTPASEAEDPVVFGSMGGVSCSEVQGALLVVDQFEVVRPVTLSHLDLPDATGVDLGDVTISRKQKGDIDLGGTWLGTEPEDAQKDDLRWGRREPLSGAEVEPGWYHYFLPFDLTGVARFRGVEISWQDDAGDGSSRQTANETFRKSCR
jgi:hypothetical protein